MTIEPDIRVDSDIPPTFSVVIPYFNNSESQLNCAIGSVVEKSNIDCVIEVILVNDGGSKLDFSSWMTGLPFGGGQVRFTLIEHSTNKGLAEARNSGIRAAKGAWIIFLDADDWFLKDGMVQIAKFVQREPNADIIYLPSVFSTGLEEDWVSIASESKIMRAATQRVPISASEHLLAETLSSWSLAYRSSFIKRIGIEFDPRLKRWEDRPFYLKALLSANSIAIMPDPVRAYFVGPLLADMWVFWMQMIFT
ncbi:glycosyltransferase [bacterium]|nr:glycosyltransferase [bacterium]